MVVVLLLSEEDLGAKRRRHDRLEQGHVVRNRARRVGMSGRVLGAALVRRRDDDALADLPLVKVFDVVPVRLVLVLSRGAATEAETRDAPDQARDRASGESASASALARAATSLDDGTAEGRSGRARELGVRAKETEL